MVVGQILKPQGIRGELKVKPLTGDPSRFCVLEEVSVNGKPYKIGGVRVSGGDVYIFLDGVSDRNAAELLRGAMLEIDRADAVPLGDGEFYISDLIGCTLIADDGKEKTEAGKIERVESFGAADVFMVKTSGGSMSFAFVKALNAVYDGTRRTLTVLRDVLDTVAVYED